MRYEPSVSSTGKLLTVIWVGGLAAWTFAVVDPQLDTAHKVAFAGGFFVASASIPLVLLREVPKRQLTRPVLFESTYRTCVPLFFGTFLILLLPDMPALLVVISVVVVAVGVIVVATSFPPLLVRRVRAQHDDDQAKVFPIRPK